MEQWKIGIMGQEQEAVASLSGPSLPRSAHYSTIPFFPYSMSPEAYVG